MFIGHLAGAELLHAVFPAVPSYVSLVGVGFPDLLWGVTILAGVESVKMGTSPLQRDIEFTRYPISHSLVLTNIIALVPAVGFGLFLGWQAALVFVLASISHWLLDVIVHKRDLPVLGFGPDIKVGFGLWNWSRTSFFVEFAIVVAATLVFEPPAKWLWIFVAALLLHLANINSFFGFTKSSMMGARGYAVLAWIGFVALAVIFSFLI